MSKFSFEEFKAFLAGKGTTFYEFDETRTYCKGADGSEDVVHYRHRLFKEPIADGEHHVDALYAITRSVSSVTGRAHFEYHPSYRCIAFVVDGTTLYRIDNWLGELIPANTITQELTFSPLYNELADYLRQTISGEKYLKDPETVSAARNFAAEKYIFGKKKSATREACQKQLGLFTSTDNIVEYLANPSTWVKTAASEMESRAFTRGFATNEGAKAVAIDSLTDDFIASFQRDRAGFPSICKDMYDSIKDEAKVYIVIKMNGKRKRIQYIPSKMANEGWLLVMHQLVVTFGVEPKRTALRSLEKFLEENWPKWNPNNFPGFPFVSIQKILSFETKEVLWENPIFEE